MDEPKKARLQKFVDDYGLIISIGMVYLVYRAGVKQGYHDAMKVFDDVCNSAAKALEIRTF